jgi:hypothetical protein
MNAAGASSGNTWRGLLAAVLAALVLAAVEARATVLLDTFGPATTTPGANYFLTNHEGNGQSLAVPFSTSTAVTVDSILAAISGTGSVTLGIMANVGVDLAGVPSNVYLHSTVLTNPTANVSLAGLGWTLAAGDYWLAAIGVDPFDGHWRGGDRETDFAFTRITDPVTDWVHFTTDLPDFEVPAARISTGAATPEPATVALIAAGLLNLALRRRRP